ncbi:MAG: transposase [Gammaproteobacteria bacterium]|nr:transposase [Gammaproteobacteria bacterium]
MGELNEKQQQLISILEVIQVEAYIRCYHGSVGRPPHDRVAMARAFVAKAVYNFTTTRMLIDRLNCDIKFRRICGWERKQDIPQEWDFSRAFSEFSEGELPQRVHQALIKKSYKNDLVGHLSRDSTAIDSREKVNKQEPKIEPQPKRPVGRPKKQRYHERSTVERVIGRLKDEFGGHMVRVRGPKKVMTHLMFGILALTADQFLKFVT